MSYPRPQHRRSHPSGPREVLLHCRPPVPVKPNPYEVTVRLGHAGVIAVREGKIKVLLVLQVLFELDYFYSQTYNLTCTYFHTCGT